jgi:MOSC domain-containing protein YiiM
VSAPASSLLTVNIVSRMRDDPAVRPNAPRQRRLQTGIDKRPVERPVTLRRLGVDGDRIGDLRVHGGPDQAVYAYAIEDTEWWQREVGPELAFPLAPGSFGENLTVRGVDVTNSLIGERWRIGSAVLQVTSPRTPCTTFAGFWGVHKLIKRFVRAQRPGAYLRVLTEGTVRAGDEVTVLDRPAHGVTLAEAFRALNGDLAAAERVILVPELPSRARARLNRRLAGAAEQSPAQRLF